MTRVLQYLAARYEHCWSMRGSCEVFLSEERDETGMRKRKPRLGCSLCTYGIGHRGGWRWKGAPSRKQINTSVVK